MRDGWVFFEKVTPTSPSHIRAATVTFVLLAIIQVISAFNFENPKKKLYLILSATASMMLLYIFVFFKFFSNFLNFTEILELDASIILFAITVYIVFTGAWKILTNKPKIKTSDEPK